MSAHKTIVEKYIRDFSSGNHEEALACLTDDVLFEYAGQASIHGKEALQSAMAHFTANDTTHPTFTMERFIEEDDSVVVVGTGVNEVADEQREFVFCDVFTFTGDMINRVETYQIQLAGPDVDELWQEVKASSPAVS